MKRKLFCLLLAGIFLCLALLPGCDGNREITVGILEEGLPMCRKTEAGVEGFEAELTELAAGRMRAHVAYRVMNATELSDALAAGKIDIALGLPAQTADAAGYIRLPYLKERQVLCVAKGSPAVTVGDLLGKRVVVERNSPADRYLAANPDVKHSFSVVNYTKDMHSALLDTMVADHDGAILTDTLAGYCVTCLQMELSILSEALPDTEEYRCMVFAPKNRDLSAETEQALFGLWEEGTLSELSCKWFGTNRIYEIGTEPDTEVGIN